MRATSLVLASLLLPASVASAELLVGPPGSGGAFTSIQAALDAAAPGERVRVLAGTYVESLSVTRAVDLVGDDTSAVTLRTPDGSAQPAVRVAGIAEGTFARVSGMRIETGARAAPQRLVEVEDCVGAVELHDLRASDAAVPPVPSGSSAALVHVVDSGLVVVSQCTFTASPLPSLAPTSLTLEGVSGARLVGSRAWITHSTFAGGWGATPHSGPAIGGAGGAGIVVLGSRVELAATTAIGGAAGGGSVAFQPAGGAGVLAGFQSQVMIAGGSGSIAQGAPAAWAEPLGSLTRYAQAGAGVELMIASSLEYATDAIFAGGSGAGPLPAGQGLVATPLDAVVAFPERLPILGYDAAIAKIGGISRRIYEGEPGSIHWVFASIQGTFPVLDFAGIGSVVCWGPPPIEAPPVVLDAAGGLTLHLPVPNDPSVAWITFVVQSVQFTPVTGLRTSPPTILRMVP